MRPTRRQVVRATVSAASIGLTGCLGGSQTEPQPETTDTGSPAGASNKGPPRADTSLHLGHDDETLRDNVVSGGVSEDGIPSIDDPTFAAAADADLDDGEPVFGVVRNGVAKAYPQYVLVWHEIVNDTVGGEPLAVT